MNKKRLRLGIIFNFQTKWMGGIIYIINVIRILDFLQDEDKPEVILFYRSDLKKFVDEIKYPYLKTNEWSFPPIFKGYLTSWLTRKNVFVNAILRKFDLDALFPLHDYPVKTNTKTKLVSWYADLQHMHYPEFFKKRKIIERTFRIRFILKNSDDLVVSSKNVADDFRRFFKIRKSMKLHIFHFVSVVDKIADIKIEDLRIKYRLPSKFYMISNQFHKHKNHKILLQALSVLKKQGLLIHFVFTGRFPDKAHSPYIEELYDIIERNKLQEQISFLGIIPREDQLILMKHSQAVIQPSLFEGWSTVIEDAKSLQVPVIASNLPVNNEQLGNDALYFNPDDPAGLASILIHYPERNLKNAFYDDYEKRMRTAAIEFINIFRY